LFDAIVLAGGRSSRLGGTPKAGLRFRGSSLLAATVASAVSRGARRVVVVGTADVADVAADVADALEPGAAGHAAGASGSAARAAIAQADGGGPVDAGDRALVIVAREEPPFGGPAAGIAAGFVALEGASGGQEDSDFILVLACDLPEVDGAVGALLAAAGEHARLDRVDAVEGADGIVAVDDEGRQQNLLAMYRTSALAATVECHRAAGDLDGLPVRRLVDGLSLGVAEVPRGSADDVDTWADAARHGIVAASVQGADGGARGAKERTAADDEEQRVVLAQWVSRLAAELGLEGVEVDVDEVLGLAGVAAHAVRRPAAPLTTFVVGYAAGLAAAGGVETSAAATQAGEVARRLAAEYAAAVIASVGGGDGSDSGNARGDGGVDTARGT
jgi:molybdopterin-guanine dinucleotide biosynthesis protein A